MADLFVRTGLEQDTGRLPERWDQDGSDYVQATDTYTFGTPSDQVIHTVTAGKVYYVKQIIILYESTAITCDIKDDGVTVAKLYATTRDFAFTFQVPIKFSTQAEWNCSGGNNTITLIGWEEKA